MARYGLPRVTEEIKKLYSTYLSKVDRNETVIPMNISEYDCGSLCLTVFVYDTRDPEYAMDRVKEALRENNVPYTQMETGPIQERTAIGDVPVFVYHHN